jgi:hypothetical protein
MMPATLDRREVSMLKRQTILACLLVGFLGFTGPAASQAPSDEQLKAAVDFVQAIKTADQMRAIFPIIVQQLKPIVTKSNPAVERDFDALAPAMTGLLNERMSELTSAIAAVYARNFSVDEMRQLAAFFRTPVGVKYLEKAPVLVQESMQIGNQFGQQTAGELERRVKEELRKRGHKL